MTNPKLTKLVGSSAALVYEVIVAHGAGAGCQVPHKTIAEATGLSVRTVRTCLSKLRDQGLLIWEQQLVEGCLQANVYRVVNQETTNSPAAAVAVPTASSAVPPRFPTCSIEVLSTSTNKEIDRSSLSGSPGSAALRAAPGSGTESKGKKREDESLDPVVLAPQPLTLWPKGSARKSALKPRAFSETFAEVGFLVAYFEAHILPRENAARQEKGWKTLDRMTASRREGWRQSALELVTEYNLAAIVEIIDWVFATRDGQLPASAVEKKRDLKLTRLRQIHRGWDALVEAMAAHAPVTAQVIHQVDVKRPPVTHTFDEAQVDDLVELFREFRSGVVAGMGRDTEVSDARARSWAETFRIMLARYSVDDIKAVIEALRECPEDVDQGRYSNAYDLNRPAEWEILRGLVDVHDSIKAGEAARPHVVPALGADPDDWHDDDDDDDWGVTRRRFRRTDPDRGPGGSPVFGVPSLGRRATDIGSPEWIARRRARYLEQR